MKISLLRTALRYAYSRIPFKLQIIKAFRMVWIHPPERIYQHLHFHGVVSVVMDDPTVKISLNCRGAISENQLFWAGLQGWYECTSMRLWLKLARQANIIVDIGSNSGIYALSAGAVNERASVFAFEPIPETYRWLKANIELNSASITAEQLAVSNINGMQRIWLQAADSHYSPSLYDAKVRALDDGIRIEVATICFDDYLIDKSLGGVDLIKIDVERHEPEVLQGMKNALNSYKPTLLIEILDNEIGKNVSAQLAGLGYYFYNINERSGEVRKFDYIGNCFGYNFLAIHPIRLSLVTEVEKFCVNSH